MVSLWGIAPISAQSGSVAAHRDTPGLVGITVPHQRLAIAAVQDGRITEFPVREGDRVRRDQLLFRQDPTVLALQVRRLELLVESDADRRLAALEQEDAQREWQRVQGLFDREIGSRAELEAAELRLQRAKAELARVERDRAALRLDLEQSELLLRQRAIKSPIDGVVHKRHHRLGETAERLQPVIELIGLEPLRVDLDVPVADQARFSRGAIFAVRSLIEPQRTRLGRVVFADVQADPGSQTVRVRLELEPNPDNQPPWPAGLKVHVGPEVDPAAPPRSGK